MSFNHHEEDYISEDASNPQNDDLTLEIGDFDPPTSFQDTEPRDELANFREQWQRELKASPSHAPKQTSTTNQSSVSVQQAEETVEDKARGLFLKGVQHEQDGKLYEAIQFYRRAVQLVPDIEKRLYEATKVKAMPREDEVVAELGEISLNSSVADEDTGEDEEEDGCDMLPRLQRVFLRDGRVCQPKIPQTSTHISSLPLELILYIFRWVVSGELDLRTLDLSCSGVSRGFFLASRDPEIWRLACVKVWGVNCGGLSNFESWRQMFIERPRLNYHGCYISKTSYIRHGENSFQDQFYRPWHLVQYYRYLRFFPDGLVLMLTTPDEPVNSLRDLKWRCPRNPTVLSGHHRIHDDHVTLVMKRQEDKTSGPSYRIRGLRRKDASQWPEPSEQTFTIELQILPHRSVPHVLLQWSGYSVITKRGSNESKSNFDLISGRFPPFWFSRVRSYTGESETPLQ